MKLERSPQTMMVILADIFHQTNQFRPLTGAEYIKRVTEQAQARIDLSVTRKNVEDFINKIMCE